MLNSSAFDRRALNVGISGLIIPYFVDNNFAVCLSAAHVFTLYFDGILIMVKVYFLSDNSL